MRLTTGTGVTMIAVGAVLTFAVSPPRWLARWIDIMDLGLVLIWVGVLVLAIHVYLHMPRRPKAPRRPAQRFEDSDRYAPGHFAAPRREERPYSPPPAPAAGLQHPAPPPPVHDDAYDAPTRRYDQMPGTAGPGAGGPGGTPPGPHGVPPAPPRPAPSGPPEDEATQYFRPRRDR